MSARPILRVCNLGVKGYNDALKIQTKYHDMCKASKKSGAAVNYLLLVEHKPVYTVGIRTAEYPESEEKRLRSLGADFVRTNRGGLITFHGPGQLTVYPILDLQSFACLRDSVRCYVSALETTVINTCKEVLGSDDRRDIAVMPGYPGVWINGQRKVAAVGIAVSERVTMHGVAINCNVDLAWFSNIVPCGIAGKGVTSLAQELTRDFTVGQAVPHFLENFRETFKCDLVRDEGSD